MSQETPKPSARAVNGNPDKMVEAITNAYDPDKSFKSKHVSAFVPDFLKRLVTKEGNKLPDLVHSAKIIEVNCFGAYKVRTIEGTAQFRAALNKATKNAKVLKKLAESGIKMRRAESVKPEDRAAFKAMGKSARFKEDFGFDQNPNDPFNEYIPIMGGPFSHQLYLHDMLDAFAKSFEAWNHNPLAHQIIKITTHFVLGRGVTVKANDDDVQSRFQDWWDKNDMDNRLDYWCDMLSRDGELMIRCFTNKMTGELFVRWVDPSTIWEIVTDLEDIEQVYYYHQQYPTQYQVLYGGAENEKYNPSNFDSSKYVINQIPAEDLYHIKINCSPNEKRGRSDLFSILGWLKRYKDFQTAIVLRAIVQSTFAWKNKLKGTNTDVQAFINQFGTDQPQFGSVWVENEASDLQPMTADVSNGRGLDDCPGIVNAIAVGSGIPKEYLGLSDHGTRATAVVASEPGVKKFQARQLVLGRLLKDLAQRWIKNEQAAGRIPFFQPAEKITKLGPSNPTDTKIEFQFPEIAVEDRSAKLKDIALVQVSGYLSKKHAAVMSAKELGLANYDYEEEMDDISKEQTDAAQELYTRTSTALNHNGGGAPNPPGGLVAPAAPGAPTQEQPAPSGGLSQQDRRDIKNNDRR